MNETPEQREARLLAEARLEAEIDHKHQHQEAIQAKESTAKTEPGGFRRALGTFLNQVRG